MQYSSKLLMAVLFSVISLFSQTNRITSNIFVDSTWKAVGGFSSPSSYVTRYDSFIWELYGKENVEFTTISDKDTSKSIYVYDKNGKIITLTNIISGDSALYTATYDGGVLKTLTDFGEDGFKLDFVTNGKLTQSSTISEKDSTGTWSVIGSSYMHYDADGNEDSTYISSIFFGMDIEMATVYKHSSDKKSDTTFSYMSDFMSGGMSLQSKNLYNVVSETSTKMVVNSYVWNDTTSSYVQDYYDITYFENGNITLDSSFNVDKSLSSVIVFSYDSQGRPKSMETFDSTGVLTDGYYVKTIGVGIITDSKFMNSNHIKLFSTQENFTLLADKNLSDMKIYSLNGSLIANVAPNKSGSQYSYNWNYSNRFGSTTAKGVYLCRLQNRSFRIVRK